MASSLQEPHISGNGRKEPHTFGRSGEPNILQRNSRSNWIHGTPAGLPFGIPGIADEIDGAMQHAPQPGRHFIFHYSCMLLIYPRRKKRQYSKNKSALKTVSESFVYSFTSLVSCQPWIGDMSFYNKPFIRYTNEC